MNLRKYLLLLLLLSSHVSLDSSEGWWWNRIMCKQQSTNTIFRDKSIRIRVYMYVSVYGLYSASFLTILLWIASFVCFIFVLVPLSHTHTHTPTHIPLHVSIYQFISTFSYLLCGWWDFTVRHEPQTIQTKILCVQCTMCSCFYYPIKVIAALGSVFCCCYEKTKLLYSTHSIEHWKLQTAQWQRSCHQRAKTIGCICRSVKRYVILHERKAHIRMQWP